MRLFVLSMLVFVASVSARSDLFDEVYARAQTQEHALRTLRAHFTEVTTSSLLRDPIVSRGTLLAEWPNRMRLDYTAPEPRTLIVDERRLVMFSPGHVERVERDISVTQRRIRKYFLDKSPAELRSHFDITADRDAKASDAYRLRMVPRRKQIEEGLKELRLWLDQKTLMLQRMEMDFPDGDGRVFTLSDVQMNAPIPAGTFDAPTASR